MRIPFNKPLVLGTEIQNIEEALSRCSLAGEGFFTQACKKWFQDSVGSLGVFPTPSCTAALEMGLMLADLKPGDEVILPSFTFMSTATAILLHGGIPVFIDSDPKTLTIDPSLIEEAITDKTKVIMPVHYAGVSCDMEKIMEIAFRYNLIVLEDAAQCVGAFFKGKPIGSVGHMSAFSFHETKNITCGEGGVLCINDQRFLERADVIRDKGSNRSISLKKGESKYFWLDKGSSYLMSELQAAFLFAQLKEWDKITKKRLERWRFYHNALKSLEDKGFFKRPYIPEESFHNAHIYYLVFPTENDLIKLRTFLKEKGVIASGHYMPLHASPAGKNFGRSASVLSVASSLPSRLLRLPLFYDLKEEEQAYIIEMIRIFYQ